MLPEVGEPRRTSTGPKEPIPHATILCSLKYSRRGGKVSFGVVVGKDF